MMPNQNVPFNAELQERDPHIAGVRDAPHGQQYEDAVTQSERFLCNDSNNECY
jgi:hypothetical protein